MAGTDGWRYRSGDEEKSAVTWADLQALARSGELADDDYVYWPERGRWVKAWEVPGLFDLASQTTASVPDAAAARRRRILTIAIAIDVVVTLAVGIVLLVVYGTS